MKQTKMLITFVSPLVVSQKSIYTFRDSRDVVRVFVGFKTDNQNVQSFWLTRNWQLRNRRGDVVRSGSVLVKLGTFDRFIDFTNLIVGEVYSLVIENPGVPDTSTVISGIDPSLITLVDENHHFQTNLNAVTIGDILCVLRQTSSGNFRQAQFTRTWHINRDEGNGLIFSGGRPFAYAPLFIYTRNYNTPDFIDFKPFPGLPVRRIVIRKVPRIESEGNNRYSITPATKVFAEWSDSGGSKSFLTTETIELLDLRLHATGEISSVKISARYD